MKSGTTTRASRAADPAPVSANAATHAFRYSVPGSEDSAPGSKPDRSFAAPRPAFPKPYTQPPTPSPSNRYSGKIEFHLSYRKQSPLTFSNRYIYGRSFAAEFPRNPRFPLALSSEINRKPGKLEHLVSHRKQRTGHQINRKLSRTPAFPFSIFTFPFPLLPWALPLSFTSHSPLVTSHRISNRKPDILES